MIFEATEKLIAELKNRFQGISTIDHSSSMLIPRNYEFDNSKHKTTDTIHLEIDEGNNRVIIDEEEFKQKTDGKVDLNGWLNLLKKQFD